jgi:hypothetical protein
MPDGQFAPIGHNSPPPYRVEILEAHQKKAAEFLDAAGDWLDLKEIGNAEHAYVVLPWAQVVKIRDGSQGYQSAKKFGKLDSNPWATHEDAMAKKTAIRALSKYLPLSVEFSDAVQIDHDGGAQVDYAGFAMNPDGGATIEGEFGRSRPARISPITACASCRSSWSMQRTWACCGRWRRTPRRASRR